MTPDAFPAAVQIPEQEETLEPQGAQRTQNLLPLEWVGFRGAGWNTLEAIRVIRPLIRLIRDLGVTGSSLSRPSWIHTERQHFETPITRLQFSLSPSREHRPPLRASQPPR